MKPVFPEGARARQMPSAFARLVAVAALGLVLGGCSTVRGWFSSDEKALTEPVELAEITPSASVSQLWSVSVGKGEGRLGARQGPVVADGRVYAAAVEGGVRALDLQSGQTVWHHESDLELSGGPGVGDGLVVAGGLDGNIVALEAASGAEKWRAEVNSEIIAAPVIGLGMVFVRSNDGRITAFDAASGERRWFWNHDVPLLSVRGNDAPVLGPGYVFVGNDDGTVTALSAPDGRPLWEQPVATAEGRTELDRMADVDGTPVLDGAMLFATSYKNQTAAIDAPTGRTLWSSEHGGPGRVALASDRIAVTTPTGIVFGLDKASGSALWQQPGLARRGVTAPAIHGDYVLVGDYDGYLHWLKLENGEFAARARAGGDAFRAAPVVADGIALVQNTDGELTAFRLGQ
jgi:outer membrane protein assembly factor BamB